MGLNTLPIGFEILTVYFSPRQYQTFLFPRQTALNQIAIKRVLSPMAIIFRVKMLHGAMVIGIHVNDDTEKPAYSRQLCHLLTFAPILSAEHYLLRIT
jgi:hypothetical protein